MKGSFGLRGAVCAAALFAGGAAQADVTAADVWADWKDQLSAYGDDNVTIGAEETSSGVVTVRDLVIQVVDVEATITTTVDTITFNEQSDGTVRITMDDSVPLVIENTADGVVINVNLNQNNLEMIVSGEPDAMNYAVTADAYSIALQDVVDGDMTLTGEASLTANNVDFAYTTTVGDLRTLTYEGTVESTDFIIDFQIPGGNGEYITAGGQYGKMDMQADMTLPLDADFENPDNLFVDGFGFDGGYTIDGLEFVMDVNAEGDQIAGSGIMGAAALDVRLDSTVLAYDAKTTDIDFSFTSSGFPLPIEVSLGEYGIGLLMPAAQSEEAADFGLSFDLVDLAISDSIWGLFDPGQVLPRDPATFQLALAGKARVLADLFDPAQQAALASTDAPFEPQEITLETLNLSVAGASVTGDGMFTFDNTDTTTFAPLPRPEGEATIQINGLNQLLDNVVSMGLVPADQVMGPRMMMGMFARSTGDDQMETSIEILPDGQVNVNGNRVR
ncbi:MAG: DUF2125 domain-containing protein [Pseudomonadota bacterium]